MQIKFRGSVLLLIAAVAVFVSTTKADTAPQIPLPQLAATRFVELSLAEEKLVNAAANGTAADCSELSGEHRKIRGKLFSWLCTDRDASAQVTYRGISVLGAEIEGLVDLESAKLSSPLLAQRCAFDALIMQSSCFSEFSGFFDKRPEGG
jgi:hypothetical protein